ncbi:MAG: ABC transporter permease [Akkermansiaceae bacterium]
MLNNRFFSPARIMVIASNTFTQLVRMKVFYFLAIFALLVVAASFIEFPWSRTTENSAEQELIVLKSTAMGTMTIFSILFAIAATALLIPKDLEDRTLYTILSKPVPRLDYLMGKLLGVLILIALSLLILNILLSIILHFRTTDLLFTEVQNAKQQGMPQDYIADRVMAIKQQGVTWSFQAGIAAMFFKAMIMASIALLISTFSSSTLFTIIISVVVYFIGHFTADARDQWLDGMKQTSVTMKYASQLIALVFPDFQIYNIVDSTIQGTKVPQGVFSRLVTLTFLYTAIYTVLSWFTFRKKEF